MAMNVEEQILDELRKLSSYADMQRKITKWSLIAVGICIPAMILFGIVMENRLSKGEEEIRVSPKKERFTWTDVDWRIRRGEPEEAIKIGEDLIQRAPQYPDGHRLVASAYLAAGKIEKAAEHYRQAFELFPSEENQKLVRAISTRIAGGRQTSGSTNRNQPAPVQTNAASAPVGSDH